MDSNIIKVLEKIENAGFKAFLVGGYVRDKLLFKNTNDIDIATNATTGFLINIFKDTNFKVEKYGTFKIRTNNYNYDITTFREEKKYYKRKPTEIIYVDDMEKDVIRRDFTINAIYMDKNGQIYDLVNGVNDLRNRKIKLIGNPLKKLKEDPLRILRAIRFATILDFQLDDLLINSIKKTKKYLKNISYERKKEELNLILLSKNALKGLDMLKKYNILKYLEINYKEINYIEDLNGMWAQLNYSDKYSMTKYENNTIRQIRQIIENKHINNRILYDYGLYISLVAGQILGYNKEQLNKDYFNLPIKSEEDLKLNTQMILKLMNIKPSKMISIIKKDLIDLILAGKLKNNKKDLEVYLKDNKWRYINEK